MAKARRVLGISLHYDAERALHTLDGVPFNGVLYAVWPNGQLDAESELRDGLNWGFSRSWYSTGQPLGEATMRAGVLHGRSREWHSNGQLAAEAEYEFGIDLWERQWSATGELVREYMLSEQDRAFKRLCSMRRTYAECPDDVPGISPGDDKG